MSENLYELMFVMDVALPEDDRRNIAGDIEKVVIDHDGEIETSEQYDVRNLAYPINDIKRGDYRLIRYRSDGRQNEDIQERLNIRDDVLRYLIIKMDQRDLNIFHEAEAEQAEAEQAETVEEGSTELEDEDVTEAADDDSEEESTSETEESEESETPEPAETT